MKATAPVHACPHCTILVQVLVFEDAPNGLESAKAAGMNVVMVPDKRTDPQKCIKADRVLGSLEELNLAEWGLPSINS
jgi:pseudouridine-5'-monophosphatase